MPLITVIIPVYNCERYISQTIECVLNQTHTELEVIVIDDGSTDGTPVILESYGDRITRISQSNQRVCAARNLGIRRARGEFICLMDHDDYWFPGKLAEQLQCMAGHPEADVVYSNFMVWNADENGTHPDPSSFADSQQRDGIDPAFSGWIYHQFLLDCWMLTSTAMFRRQVFDKCGVFDEALPFSEDWELWLRMSRVSQFIKLNKPTTLYRQHRSQGNRVLRAVDYRTQLLERAAARWGLCSSDGRCVPPQQFRRQLARYHIEFARHHLSAGDLAVAYRSLSKAFRLTPWNLKIPAYAIVSRLGWRLGY